VDGVKNAVRAPMAWYVSYRTGGRTVMHILKSRELAIDAACRFLDRGHHDALEVGPKLGSREGSVSIPQGEIPRETDCLLEGDGFELPVREHRAMAPSHGFAAATHKAALCGARLP